MVRRSARRRRCWVREIQWVPALYASGTIGISNQLTATRLVKFNTGTTNVAIWAYKLTAVTCTLNYASLRIVPVRWV